MSQASGTRDSAEDAKRHASGLVAASELLLTGVGFLAQTVGFWSAIVLPFVAVALLAVQPPGWMPALVAVFAADGIALYLGHCHDRSC